MSHVGIVCVVICIICTICIIVSCITTSRYIVSKDKQFVEKVRLLVVGKERNGNENKAKNKIEK